MADINWFLSHLIMSARIHTIHFLYVNFFVLKITSVK
jgi:hypothetical protein